MIMIAKVDLVGESLQEYWDERFEEDNPDEDDDIIELDWDKEQ